MRTDFTAIRQIYNTLRPFWQAGCHCHLCALYSLAVSEGESMASGTAVYLLRRIQQLVPGAEHPSPVVTQPSLLDPRD